MPDTESSDYITHPDPRICDLSYSRGRMRQLVDLNKGSFISTGLGPLSHYSSPVDDEDWPRDRIEIYIKEKTRGPDYVCDIIYRSEELPVTVYAVLLNRGRGLEITELELFRESWGCEDEDGNYLDPDEQRRPVNDPAVLISSDVLRRIPLGDILTRVEQELSDESWRTEGIPVLMGSALNAEDLTADQRRALENLTTISTRRRGRPELDDELLIEIAEEYIAEAPQGRGAIRRLAQTFDRPEPTIRDWIAAARRRGFLAPAEPGRRGVAAPGPNLPAGSAGGPDFSRDRRRTIVRMIEGDELLSRDLSEDSQLLYIVGALICNAAGIAKTDDLAAAMRNPEILSTAVDILGKARRRHAVRNHQ
ncbi:hypothetical protein [Nocardia sp. NPDC051463]|uniref:hypothetical protein n=1 Tax=Nocardia sp. NPDC051463 TaxID=3154845 RepID=UPI00343551DC